MNCSFTIPLTNSSAYSWVCTALSGKHSRINVRQLKLIRFRSRCFGHCFIYRSACTQRLIRSVLLPARLLLSLVLVLLVVLALVPLLLVFLTT